jgi:anti-sigma regulatory factor (Ser/Thr protein kinase)
VVLLSRAFVAGTVTAACHALAGRVAAVGLCSDGRDDFVLAARELMTNAVRHGGGSGHLELRRHGEVLTCEVSDAGLGVDWSPPRLPAAELPGGPGLRVAFRLTGALVLAGRADRVSVAVCVCLPPAPAGPNPAGEVPPWDRTL